MNIILDVGSDPLIPLQGEGCGGEMLLVGFCFSYVCRVISLSKVN